MGVTNLIPRRRAAGAAPREPISDVQPASVVPLRQGDSSAQPAEDFKLGKLPPPCENQLKEHGIAVETKDFVIQETDERCSISYVPSEHCPVVLLYVDRRRLDDFTDAFRLQLQQAISLCSKDRLPHTVIVWSDCRPHHRYTSAAQRWARSFNLYVLFALTVDDVVKLVRAVREGDRRAMEESRASIALATSKFEAPQKVKLFISYSHTDEACVAEHGDRSIMPFMKSLEKKNGFQIFCDRDIATGRLWDEAIKAQVLECDIALILVSQDYLNSNYCQEEEVAPFIKRRDEGKLTIYPLIVSACQWQEHAWLKATQFQPRGGRFLNKLQSPELSEIFNTVADELKKIGVEVQNNRTGRAVSHQRSSLPQRDIFDAVAEVG